MNRVSYVFGAVLLAFNALAEMPTGWITRFSTNSPSLKDPGQSVKGTIERTGVFGSRTVKPSNRAVLKMASANAVAPLAATGASLPATVSLGIPLGFSESGYERIKELARSLDYNWDKCYRYVRDNIAFTPYVGFLRGPERTLLDKEGSDGDQAFLLLALLKASGYTATVEYLPLGSSSAYLVPLWHYNSKYTYNAADWLGVPIYDGMGINDLYQQCYKKLTTTGVGCAYYYDSGNDEYYICTSHFWVLCVVEEGKNYYLDPSLKPTVTSPARNVKTDMKYNRSTLISSAGGTVGTSYVRNLSTANLAARLNAYSANLRSAWTNTNANAAEYVGASSIIKQTDDSYWNAATLGTVYDFLGQTEATINNFRGVVTLTHGTISKQFYLDEIGTRNLWLSYQSASTTYPKGILKLDDTTIATESTGSATEAVTMGVKVAYPGASEQTYNLKRNVNNTYVIPVAFDGDSRNGMRKVMMEKLADVCTKGYAAGDGRVVSRAMQAVGQQWATQTALLNRLRNRLQGNDYRCFYNFGVAGWENGPYVDLKNSFSRRMDNHQRFDGYALFYSALEHAALDQVLGTNTPSISTVRVLDLANKAGNNIYYMTSNNYSSVGGSLSGYSSSLVTSMKNSAKNGMRYLLPASGSLKLNSWTGYGYVQHGLVSADAYVTAMLIDGNRNGAKSTWPTLLSYSREDYTDNTPTFYLYEQVIDYADAHKTPVSVPTTFTADPIAMPSGAFTDNAIDLTINSATPLIWGRSYDARQNSCKSEMGYGWMHSYDMSVTDTTSPDAVFGAESVDAVIPTAVAIAVVDDMLSDQETLTDKENARRWMIAALTVQWWTEHLTASTVAVDIGNKTMQFQCLDDGTYSPYPGVTAILKKENGAYVLTERLGSSYYFNTDNRLAKIVDRSGNATTLTYANGKLTGVANDYGAKFTISYSGDLISSVTDNIGRTVRYSYSNNCLTQITDPLSKNWKTAYDTTTRLITKQTDPDGMVTVQNTYNDFGQVIRQIDANGKTWSFGYVGANEFWEEDPLGRRNSQTYDDDGRLLTRLERDGSTSECRYDGHGHVTVTRNPLGRIDFCGYDGRDNMIWKAEAGGAREESYTYDAKDRLVEVINALGQKTKLTYDSCDRQLVCTLPDGSRTENTWTTKGLLSAKVFYSPSGREIRRTTYTYGTLGLPISTKVTGVGLPSAGIVESITYDNAGQPLTKTDANGNTTSFTYDNRGMVTKMTNPLSKATTYTYNGAGRMTKVTNARSKSTTTAYTASGNIASTTYADGGKVTNEYDDSDNLKKTIDERGAAVSCTRDALGRVITVSDKVGKDSYVYNAAGLLLRSTNAVGVVTTVNYDSLYRPVLSNDGRGGAWWTEYDLLDRPVAKKNPIGKIDRTTYDVMGRTAAVTRPSGAVDRFGYDEFGNMSSYTNSEGKVYTMQYDALGRMISATNGEGEKVFTAEYDGVGNLLSRTDRKGNRRTFEYDKVNRLVKRSFGGKTEAFVYDDVGNMTSASNVNALTTFTYDSCNRMTYSYMTIYPASGVTSSKRYFTSYYKRDLGGLVTNVTYGSTSKSVSRTYDESGNLTSVKDWLGHTWTFQYDAAGKMTRQTSPDGVNSTFTYDAAERLIGWKVGNIAGRGIELDAAGRRLQDTITAGTMPRAQNTRRAQNVYDNADRIISATVSNGTSAPTREAYEYDENGALVNVMSDGTSVFSAVYTKNGFVESVCGNAFVYDALDNRLAASDKLWIPDYTDSLSRPLAEYSTSWSVVRYYIWGQDCLLGYIDSNGTLTIVHSDEMGNVIALTTTSGTVLHTATYGPNGEDWGTSGSNPTPYAWLGGYGVQKIDCGVCMGSVYSTRHRLYSINLHRFLSSDPIGLNGGLNLYAYGEGNPLALIDPLGLCGSSPSYFGMTGNQFGQFMNDSLARTQNFLADMGTGAVKGDFSSKNNIATTIGQIGAGAIPIAGQVADARDTVAAIRDVKSNPKNIETWANLGFTAAAWVPIVGDGAKSAWKARKLAKSYRVVAGKEAIDSKRLMSQIHDGSTVYRVHGGGSSRMGHSWTTVHPLKTMDYRGQAGLPDVNDGVYLTVGRLKNTHGISARKALPLDGNKGGAPEYLIPNPEGQVIVTEERFLPWGVDFGGL